MRGGVLIEAFIFLKKKRKKQFWVELRAWEAETTPMPCVRLLEETMKWSNFVLLLVDAFVQGLLTWFCCNWQILSTWTEELNFGALGLASVFYLWALVTLLDSLAVKNGSGLRSCFSCGHSLDYGSSLFMSASWLFRPPWASCFTGIRGMHVPQMFYSAAHQCGMSCPSILILSMFSVCCSAHHELINCSYLKLLSCM